MILFGYGDDFLEKKERMGKWHFIITKKICFVKDSAKRNRKQTTDWEKILVKDPWNIRLLSKIYTQFLKFDKEVIKNPTSLEN